MNLILEPIQKAFNFLNSMTVGGVSMVTWIVIVIVISGLGFIIRGNK